MKDLDLSQLDDNFDRINDFDEDDDWTSAIFGDEEEVIRQLVG